MSTVAIAVGGVDVTPIVIFEDASFSTMVSGVPGAFRFRVRDLTRSESFTVGDPVTVTVDGTLCYTGFLTSVSRQFFFPVDQPAGLSPRALVLQGVDINILFRKRIVADYLGDPANVLLRNPYPAGTFDSVVVADLVANYLDLSGDGLDTSTLVEHIGTPNPDLEGRVAFGSYTWESAMNVIIKLTGAIYYIDPDKRLILTDVDTPNASYSLSDTPDSDPGSAPYRDMELSFDGGALANDALVWGAGQGSASMVFARVQDAASIAEHGLWQWGDFRQDIFRQASVDHRADSYVNGSALNHRGHKDDAHSVMVTTHVPGFRAAQKVDFISHVWGFEEVIPIRRMDITFDTPTDPRFRLTLSHNIDEPWNIYEWWLPPIPPIPPIQDGITFGAGFDPCTGYFDDFDRADFVGSYGLTSQTQQPWIPDDINSNDWGILAKRAWVNTDGVHTGPHVFAHVADIGGSPWTRSPIKFKARFRVEGIIPVAAGDGPVIDFTLQGPSALVHFSAKVSNFDGFYAVDDAGNGWFASQSKTDWAYDLVNYPAGNVTYWYIMEGFGYDTLGGIVTVYQEGSSAPDAAFFYDDGSVMGIAPGDEWQMNLSPLVAFTDIVVDYLDFDSCTYDNQRTYRLAIALTADSTGVVGYVAAGFSGGGAAQVFIDNAGFPGAMRWYLRDDLGHTYLGGDFSTGVEHVLVMGISGTFQYAYLDGGTPVEAPIGAWSGSTAIFVGNSSVPNTDPNRLHINYLRSDVGEIDDFNRTVASGWGAASSGGTWGIVSGTPTWSVGSGLGNLRGTSATLVRLDVADDLLGMPPRFPVNGWVSEIVIPDSDQMTLLLHGTFSPLTARVEIDGNVQSIAEYDAFPTEGRIVFSVPIPLGAIVVVTYYGTGSRI